MRETSASRRESALAGVVAAGMWNDHSTRRGVVKWARQARSTATTPFTFFSAFITPFSCVEVRADEREEVHRAPVVARAAVGLADVDPLGHERLPDVGEDARAVRGHDAELHAAVDPRLAVPGDLDAPLGVGVERLRAAAAVDGDAAPARDEAEDVVAGERVAALGVAHEHVVDPVDADRALVALDDLAHEAREAPLAELLRRLGSRALLVGRRDDLERRPPDRSCRSRCR